MHLLGAQSNHSGVMTHSCVLVEEIVGHFLEIRFLAESEMRIDTTLMTVSIMKVGGVSRCLASVHPSSYAYPCWQQA